MWNPETYRDTDYGLNPDESFEPDEMEYEFSEPAQSAPHIQTVLGRIDPEDAGLALVREYLHREPHATDQEHQLTDQNAALLDLEAFFTVGGRTVVDATSEEEGRSASQLVWLAQRAPVHIVASTGGLIESQASIAYLKDGFDGALNGGPGELSVLPGLVVLELGPTLTISGAREAFSVIAEGTQHRPLPVAMLMQHSSLPPLEVMEAAKAVGIAATRIILGGARPGHELSEMETVAKAGAYLLFDHLGEGTFEQNMETAVEIAGLVDAGLDARLLLSHAYDRRSLLNGYGGGPGLAYIVEQFAIMLLEAGASALDVRTMLLDNCASALTIQPNQS